MERGLTQEFIIGLLIFKIGGFPFHQWAISLIAGISWEAITVILTLQKIIPLHLLAHRRTVSILALRRIGWIFLRISSLLVRKTKKLILLSSVFFLAALVIIPLLSGGRWKKLLLIYFVIFFFFMLLGGGEKDVLVSSPSSLDSIRGALWLFVLLTLRGSPPFLGFFLKLEVSALLCENRELLRAALFLLTRAVFLYIYISLILHFTFNGFAVKGASKKRRSLLKVRVFGLSRVIAIFLF